MNPLLRKVVIAVLVVVLVPGAALVSIGFLRWLGLGLRLADEKTKADYLIGAAQNKARQEVGRLLKLGIVAASAEDEVGYTALMGAALGGDADIVRMLLDDGASVNAAVRSPGKLNAPAGLTALMLAARGGHFEAAARLLDRGADPNRAIAEGDFRGYTALFMAVEGGNLEIVEALLAKGAKVDAQYLAPSKAFAFPLTRALTDNRADIAERLVAYGGNPDWLIPAGSMQGCTQLMLLVGAWNFPVSEQTIEWLASRTKLKLYRPGNGPCRGFTALDLAVAWGNLPAVRGMLSPTVGIVGKGMIDELQLSAYRVGAIHRKDQPMADLLLEHLNRCKKLPDCRVPDNPYLQFLEERRRGEHAPGSSKLTER